MRATVLILALSLTACSLEERADFLVGRRCQPDVANSCDGDQKCLPHAIENGLPADFRCRDKASFAQVAGKDPPLAYCDETNVCPDGLICNADRIRDFDGGLRPTVCQLPGNPFGPPLGAPDAAGGSE